MAKVPEYYSVKETKKLIKIIRSPCRSGVRLA